MSGPRIIPVGAEPAPMDAAPAGRPDANGHDERRGHKRQGYRSATGKRRSGERFGMLNGFVDFTLAGLRRNDIAVWMILYRDTRNDMARTSQTDIARRAGASVRTVQRALGRLERAGLLVVVRRGRLSAGPSVYRVRGVAPA